MTDEELEKKAEKYFKNIGKECGYDKEFEETGKRHYWIGLDIKKAYIAGAKENGLQWHDLWKNPQDLPEDKEFKITDKGNIGFYDSFWNKWYYWNSNEMIFPPIAWCELPKFEE